MIPLLVLLAVQGSGTPPTENAGADRAGTDARCLLEAAEAARAAPVIEPQFDAGSASRIGTAIGAGIVRNSERRRALKTCRTRSDANRPAVRNAAEQPAGSPVGALSHFRDCAECPDMIVLPAGRFSAGPREGEVVSGAPAFARKAVAIARPFAIGAREVTVGEYRSCVEAGACTISPATLMAWQAGSQLPPRPYPSHDAPVRRWDWRDLPVSGVSHDDAMAYAGWLTRRTARAYRLPSSTEWEYAARAGSETRYPWGNAPAGTHATVKGTAPFGMEPLRAGGSEYPVAVFAPNRWGLFDVVGGVGELTADCAAAPDLRMTPADGTPYVAQPCPTAVIRGGVDWPTPTLAYWTAAFRNNRVSRVGFRLAADF